MSSRSRHSELKRAVAAMPKCSTCGGFAIPSATTPGAFVCKDHGQFLPVAEGREEHEPCERGTVGCSVLHGSEDTECATW